MAFAAGRFKFGGMVVFKGGLYVGLLDPEADLDDENGTDWTELCRMALQPWELQSRVTDKPTACMRERTMIRARDSSSADGETWEYSCGLVL
jgi:hypothetical protein